MSTITLIGGGGLGAWAWRRVAPALRASGHDVHPLTLTGTGDRAHLGGPGVDLETWVTDVVASLAAEELEDVVLVGHSFACAVVSGVAERVPERLRRLVFLDGAPLRDGESVFAAAGPEFAGFLEGLAAEHDGWSLPWLTDAQLDEFWGDHGLTSDDLAWLRRHVTAQPLATYRQALAIGSPAAAALPRTFVHCTGTPGPPAVDPDAPGWDRARLETGHWPMVTAPAACAGLLDAVASDRAG
jgi:pimeloyl-ACP methyl ester carboxylesterase